MSRKGAVAVVISVAALALFLVWLAIEQLRLFVLAIAFAVAAVTTF